MKQEKLKQLNALLGAEMVITGSTALAYHGLLTMEEAIDLDIILVKPSEVTKEVLNRLQKDNPSPKWKEGSPINHSFIYDGIKVDVWFVDKHESLRYLVNEDGIRVSSIKYIVSAKLSYGRSKDWIQLMQLSKKIFDPMLFNSALPSIKNHSEDYTENIA